MLFNLLLANIRILSWFFILFLVVLNNIFDIPVVKEKINVKPALAIPTGVPITLVREIIDTLPLFALRTIKTLSMQSNTATYLHNFLLFNFCSLISWLKQFSVLLISFSLSFVLLVKFVLSVASIELLSFIFEMTQNYIVIFLKKYRKEKIN